MNPFILAALIVLLLAAVWLAWLYIRLRRRLALYTRALRDAPPLTLPMADGELESLAVVVRSLVGDFNRQRCLTR
jgi:hypothetical protein